MVQAHLLGSHKQLKKRTKIWTDSAACTFCIPFCLSVCLLICLLVCLFVSFVCVCLFVCSSFCLNGLYFRLHYCTKVLSACSPLYPPPHIDCFREIAKKRDRFPNLYILATTWWQCASANTQQPLAILLMKFFFIFLQHFGQIND